MQRQANNALLGPQVLAGTGDRSKTQELPLAAQISLSTKEHRDINWVVLVYLGNLLFFVFPAGKPVVS
jgi:hypothetical protein